MKRFGKYVLYERIAAGGMAEVFKGGLPGDAGFERQVAIKRILPNLGEDPDFVSMFIDEAKIAVQLSHSNIAQILDLGCHDGTYFIAMEYVHGRDFRAILERERERGRAVPVAVACHAAMKVAEALHHAHRATSRSGAPLGVIHRDISPQNILLSFEGEVKVVDFGLAKASGRATQTQAGVVKGKLAYLSPQQALGQDLDGRTDLYSLGLVLFELLTGRRVYDRPNDVDTILAVQAGEVPPLRRVDPHMPPHLEAIVARALERDPDLRYPTGMELHDDLEAFVYEHDQLVTRKDVASYVRDLFGEHPVVVATAATVLEDQLVSDTIPAPPPDPDATVERELEPELPHVDEVDEADEAGEADEADARDGDAHDTWITELRPPGGEEPTRVAEPEGLADLVDRSREEE